MDKIGLLYRCSTKECKTVRWDKTEVRVRVKKFYKGSKRWKKEVSKILLESGVEPEKKYQYHVYKLKMSGELKPRANRLDGEKVYIGQTGLHPYQRYLHHILGYQTTRVSNTYELASDLIGFHGPYYRTDIKDAEKTISVELHMLGFEVYGDGLPLDLQKERDQKD